MIPQLPPIRSVSPTFPLKFLYISVEIYIYPDVLPLTFEPIPVFENGNNLEITVGKSISWPVIDPEHNQRIVDQLRGLLNVNCVDQGGKPPAQHFFSLLSFSFFSFFSFCVHPQWSGWHYPNA